MVSYGTKIFTLFLKADDFEKGRTIKNFCSFLNLKYRKFLKRSGFSSILYRADKEK